MSAVAGRPAQLHAPRVLVLGAASLLGAFVAQTSILPAVGLSAAVPLVWTTVAVLAMAWGPRPGAVAGFGVGLLLDLTGAGVIGVGALVGCVLGVAAAAIPEDRRRWSGLGWVVAAVLMAAITDSVLNGVLDGRAPHPTTAWLWTLGGAIVCALVLLPARGWLRAVVR